MGIPRDTHSEEALARELGLPMPSEQMDRTVLECRRRVELSTRATQRFRRQRRTDRAFMASQYTADDLRERDSTRRPALQLHLIQDRVQRTMHEFREADIGFRIGSATSDANAPGVAAFNGLAIRDQRDSLSALAWEKIAFEACMYGQAWGAWEIVDDDGTSVDASPMLLNDDGSAPLRSVMSSGAFDRRLRMRAADNDNVYEDPHDDTPDRRNMDFLVEVRRMTMESRDALYPDAKRLPPDSFTSLAGDDFWYPMRAGGSLRDREVRIAHYYRRRYETLKFVWMPEFGEQAYREDRLSKEALARVDAYRKMGGEVQQFEKKVPLVELFVLDGAYLLAKPYVCRWGRIPFFRAVGLEFDLNDGETIQRGWVYLLRDLTKWMAVTASDMVFKQAIAGQDGWVVAAEAIRMFEDHWRDTTRPMSVKKFSAFSKVVGPDGRPLPLPPPQYHTSQPAVDSAAASIGVARELAAATAGSTDAPQRESVGQYRSGEALERMDRLSAVNRSPFIYSMEHNTARASGEIYTMIVPYVYNRPGRLVYVSGERSTDGDEGWLISVPFVRDPATGAPVPVPDVAEGVDMVPQAGAVQQPGGAQGAPPMQKVHRFDPAALKPRVRSFSGSTEKAGRDSRYDLILELIRAAPDVLTRPLVVPLLEAASENQPLEAAIKSVKATLPPPVDPADVDASQMPDLIRNLTQQLQQMTEQNEQLQQAAAPHEAAKHIAELRAENERVIAEFRGMLDIQKTEMNLEQKREQAVLDAQTKSGIQVSEAKAKAVIEGVKQSSETARAAMKTAAEDRRTERQADGGKPGAGSDDAGS